MTGEKHVIKSFAGIKKGRILLNGSILYESIQNNFDEMMDDVYRKINLAYPKFHKMDQLSKLGFMTSEFLLRDQNLTNKYEADKIGIVLSNKSSSLDTDLKYHSMLSKGIASPAVFVYTLPNILIGELCIRNKIKGESIFFISDRYNIKQQVDYIRLLLNAGVLEACIAGWVEFFQGRYESFLYLVTKEDDNNADEYSKESVEKLFNQI